MAAFTHGFAGANDLPMPQTFRPQMTSLIDILTLLLVFLIQSFSAEGNLITVSEDLKLPLSTSTQQPKPAFTVEITQKAILSDGKLVSEIAPVIQSKALLMDNLYRYLLEKKRALVDTSGGREVIIQCDENMPFQVVKKVMFTCSKAGFEDFSVLAIQKD
jgi:biopolymer transport protein ExbD